MTTKESKASSEKETFAFEAGAALIRHTIESQTGSLGKACAECLMNSIDAGATRIDIILTHESIAIVDDGAGFASRDEILSCFRVFGLDHSDNKNKIYGKFGLGRGQLWNYCSTRWRTNQFAMDVDIRASGFGFDLVSNLEHFPGLQIEGTFYEPLTRVDVSDAERHIAKLCRYCNVAIFINGKAVSMPASKESWTYEDDDMWFRLEESSRLSIYNQGVFVVDEYIGLSGVGGTIVTKSGVNLELNIARNDVLRAKCSVWPRIRKVLLRYSETETKSASKRLTDGQRDWLASQTADPENFAVWSKPLFTCCNGRHRNWNSVMLAMGRGQELTVCERGNTSGEVMLREKTAVVLSPETLARFDVGTARELFALMKARCEDMIATLKTRQNRMEFYSWKSTLETAGQLVVDDLTGCKGYRMISHEVLRKDELTEIDMWLVKVASDMSHKIAAVLATRDGYEESRPRDIVLFDGSGARAFTDGSSYIALQRKFVRSQARLGIGGFLLIAHLLLHEYLHSVDTAGSHTHDHDFYEMFESVVIDDGTRLLNISMGGLRVWLQKGPALSRKVMRELDSIEADADGAGSGTNALLAARN